MNCNLHPFETCLKQGLICEPPFTHLWDIQSCRAFESFDQIFGSETETQTQVQIPLIWASQQWLTQKQTCTSSNCKQSTYNIQGLNMVDSYWGTSIHWIHFLTGKWINEPECSSNVSNLQMFLFSCSVCLRASHVSYNLGLITVQDMNRKYERNITIHILSFIKNHPRLVHVLFVLFSARIINYACILPGPLSAPTYAVRMLAYMNTPGNMGWSRLRDQKRENTFFLVKKH